MPHFIYKTMSESLPTGSITGKIKTRLIMVIVAGAVALLLMVLASLALGTVNYSFHTVVSTLIDVFKNGVTTGIERTIYNLRFPRVLAAFGVGAGLAVAGTAFQAIVRNPLVDPYMTGVSSGAGLGATLYMVFFSTVAMVSYLAMPLFAFAFAVLAFFCTLTISKISGNSNVSFVLAGVIIAMGFGAVTTIIMLTNEQYAHGILGFLYGSFSSISWNTAAMITVPVIIVSSIFILYSRTFNVILLGREQSMELGVNYDRFRIAAMLAASFLSAICVAFVGIIGFVGLIVPHLARMIFGGDHRLIFITSMIIGALLLSSADILVKEIINVAGITVPIGAITTLIGVPFFVFILKKRGKGYA